MVVKAPSVHGYEDCIQGSILFISDVQPLDMHVRPLDYLLTHSLRLAGKPRPVKVISEPNGNYKNMYKIRWSVDSYAEPIEYKILYRKLMVSLYLRLQLD